MCVPDINADLRREMVRLIRENRFSKAFSREAPVDWRPYEVRNPSTNELFTEKSAQEYIAKLLEDGHPVSEIKLTKPPGKRGFEMKKALNADQGELYVKLQMGQGCVICRSFHLSD